MKDLKSKVLREFDFRKADVSEVDFTYEADKDFIENELLRIKKKNKITNEVDEVKKGDIVLCSLKSETPKYNREIKINTGLGIFNKEVEAALAGMKKEEINIASADGYNVSVEVLKIERSELPEVITDEMAAKEGIEGVDTVKDLKEHLMELHQKNIDDAIDSKAYYLIDHVLKQVVPQSEYEIYEEDIQYLCELEIQRARALAENEGFVLEKMTEKELDGRIPVKSYEEFLDMVHNMKKNQIYVLIMGLKKAKKDGYETPKEEYEEFFKDYYTMCNMAPEVARKVYPWEYYETNDYLNYYEAQIYNYYKDRFHEI